MFEEKSLLYCTPFYFKDGNIASPKYFLVLKNLGDGVIVANLPSSKVYVPFPDENVNNGCIHLPDLNFSCYCVDKGIAITDIGYEFRLPTFIYGKWIEDYLIDTLKLTYRVKDEDYTYCGKLNDDIYKSVVDCLKKSTSIKRKFKKMIETW